eukprot:g4497.t1
MGRLASKKRVKRCDPFSKRPGDRYESGFGMHGAYNLGGKKGCNADLKDWKRSKHKNGPEYLSSKEVAARKAKRNAQREKNKRKRENAKQMKSMREMVRAAARAEAAAAAAAAKGNSDSIATDAANTTTTTTIEISADPLFNRSLQGKTEDKTNTSDSKRRPGESMKAFARRMRSETTKILIDSVKKDQKGYKKRKAFLQAQKEKKRRKKMGLPNIDEENMTVENAIANGEDEWTAVAKCTPILEMPEQEEIRFGDVVDRPPTLTMVPKKRFKAEAQGKKKSEEELNHRMKKEKEDLERRKKNRQLMKAQAAYKLLKQRRRMNQ